MLFDFEKQDIVADSYLFRKGNNRYRRNNTSSKNVSLMASSDGTIRGDYSMSFQENIVHASDSPETAEVELKRFFKPEEIFEYKQAVFGSLYANDEY